MALGKDLPSTELGAIRELALHHQWVAWKAIVGEDGKTKKTPINPVGGRNASVGNPNTWGTHEQADLFARATDVNGVGFVLSGIDGYCCIDLDKIRDPDTGEMQAWAEDVVRSFNTYTEVSPSGTGLHLWLRGRPPGGRCRTKGIEIYGRKRFMTITGQRLELVETDEIEERQEQLEQLYDEAFNVTKISGTPPKHELPPTETKDPHGFPFPSSGQWTFEEALYYAQRVMQDGRPHTPSQKLLALNSNDRKFNRVWRKVDATAEKACGDDQSAWDLALCNRMMAADVEFTWHETIAILIDFRGQYDKDQTKLMRADYWARTISKASDRYTKRLGDKHEKAQENRVTEQLNEITTRFEEAKEAGDKVGQKQAILDVCERIACPEIIKITRALRKTSPLFIIHFGDEEFDKIEGDVSLLTSQAKFSKAIASRLLRMLRPMTKSQWENVASMLLNAVDDEEVTDDTSTLAQTIEWLQGYLASQPRPMDFTKDTYLTDGPWKRQGQLIIKLATFETYLRRFHRVSIERMEMARRLNSIGVRMRRASWRIGDKVSSLSVYVVPEENNFHAIADNAPQEVEIVEDGEE